MSAPPNRRFASIDAWRGLACIWMALYHFCFDLSAFGWRPEWNFYQDPVWTWQRTGILSSFLLCAGIGQGMASLHGQSWRRFWSRWWQVAAAALVVSAASYWAFQQRFIYFGVLHGIAVMLIVVRLLAPRLPALALLLLGLALIAGQQAFQMASASGPVLPAVFDTRSLNWLGLISHKPGTEDYVPLLPWLGPMLLGAGLAPYLAASRAWANAQPPAILVWLGQHSLSFYLLHQPIFWGLLYLASSAH